MRASLRASRARERPPAARGPSSLVSGSVNTRHARPGACARRTTAGWWLPRTVRKTLERCPARAATTRLGSPPAGSGSASPVPLLLQAGDAHIPPAHLFPGALRRKRAVTRGPRIARDARAWKAGPQSPPTATRARRPCDLGRAGAHRDPTGHQQPISSSTRPGSGASAASRRQRSHQLSPLRRPPARARGRRARGRGRPLAS